MSTRAAVGLVVRFYQNPIIFRTPKCGYCPAIVVDVLPANLATLVVYDADGYVYKRKRVLFVQPGAEAPAVVDYYRLLGEPEADPADSAHSDDPQANDEPEP